MGKRGKANPHVPESPSREHADMPPAVGEPAGDVNLEEQTSDRVEPGPGASKMENLRRVEAQVRVQRERAEEATRPQEQDSAQPTEGATPPEEEG